MAHQKELVKRLGATVLAAALLVGFWPSKILIVIGAVTVLPMIWWRKAFWLAPALAVGAAAVVLLGLLTPQVISNAWLWRGVSLCIEMVLLTAVTKIVTDAR